MIPEMVPDVKTNHFFLSSVVKSVAGLLFLFPVAIASPAFIEPYMLRGEWGSIFAVLMSFILAWSAGTDMTKWAFMKKAEREIKNVLSQLKSIDLSKLKEIPGMGPGDIKGICNCKSCRERRRREENANLN